MREQTRKFVALLAEFQELKKKLFGASLFREVSTSTKFQDRDETRYDNLLGFFYPQCRTANYTSPATELENGTI